MNQQTSQILSAFEGFRMAPTPIDQYESVGKPILADRIDKFVSTKHPIEFVMLGFPFKSTNDRDKVIGKLPDFGEQLTVENFGRFNDVIKSVYEPGIRISMASDGYVFNDILGVDDKTVSAYQEVSADMARGVPIQFYNLNDFYSGESIDSKRDRLMSQMALTPEKLSAEILLNPDVNFLYRGMIKFMEQELAIKNFPSRNQLQKAAKALTREMMMRNEAYSNLIRHEFAGHIRLSMHPSVNNGQKYSFQLINSPNAHMSPWHCAIAVDPAGQIQTIHRKDAITAGYRLVEKDGRPYYFETL